MNQSSKTQKQIILFDGVCNFCNYWINFIIKHDNKDVFKFAALQSDFAKDYLDKFGYTTNRFDTFILIEEDEHFIKSTAALKIAKQLKGWIKLFSIFIIIPSFLRNPFYNLIAKNRYKIFGKKEACRIPAPEEKSKFLE